MKILTLDLGKYKNVFCEFVSQNGTQEYGKVTTRPKAVHDLLVERQPDGVVVEIGTATGWVYDPAFGLGFPAEEALRHKEKEFFDRITGFLGLNGHEKAQGTQKIRISLFLRLYGIRLLIY